MPAELEGVGLGMQLLAGCKLGPDHLESVYEFFAALLAVEALCAVLLQVELHFLKVQIHYNRYEHSSNRTIWKIKGVRENSQQLLLLF